MYARTKFCQCSDFLSPHDTLPVYSEIHFIICAFSRKYVIYKFPTLKFLDSKEVTVTERKEANRTGQYLRPVKPITVS